MLPCAVSRSRSPFLGFNAFTEVHASSIMWNGSGIFNFITRLGDSFEHISQRHFGDSFFFSVLKTIFQNPEKLISRFHNANFIISPWTHLNRYPVGVFRGNLEHLDNFQPSGKKRDNKECFHHKFNLSGGVGNIFAQNSIVIHLNGIFTDFFSFKNHI